MPDRSEGETVVITGVGCVSPVGVGAGTSWQAILAGKGGVVEIDRFDASSFPVRIAAQVPGFNGADWLSAKEARRTDRFIQFAVAATDEAVAHAGLKITPEISARVGVVIGSAMGGMETIDSGFTTLATKGPSRVSPFFVPMMLADMASGIVSIRLGARGVNLATVSACASGAHAIGEAAAMIARGDVDVVVAGGSEAAITPAGVAGFAAAGALSTRNDDPTHASRPFDRERDGFVLGEGAGIVILESLRFARQRGATILAAVTGYGATADASHIVQPGPDGEGAARAMTLALTRAGLSAADISYINTHGTSTKLNDAFETRSIRTVFGADAPPASSTKGATGHLLGAAGAVEAVFSVLALQSQTMPPTINYEVPDPDCDLDCVPNTARQAPLAHIVSNSLGFGGHNVSLVFSAPDARS